MPPNRRLRATILLLLGAALLTQPAPAAGAEPTLGEAVTLPDGTVLPPMPPELIAPSIQAEMADEHGGLGTQAPEGDISTLGGIVERAAPLGVVETAAIGLAGHLPNSLTHEVLGFLPYWKLDATTRASLRYDLLSTIAYFGISAQSDGHLTRGTSTGWTGWTSAGMTAVMNAAHARGVRVVPTVTFMSWSGDYTGLTALLNTPANRARLVGEIASIIRDRGADGVNVDFEPVPASLRGQFTTFIRELKAGLLNAGVGSYLTVSTVAGAAAWSTGYDVVGLTAAGAADALMVMAYDFHYAGSTRAGSPAPIESDFIYASADAMRDHLARVPASKLIWGVPYYGRAWNTATAAQNSLVRAPAQSVAFSYYWTDNGAPAGGRVLAERFGRRWDPTGQVPWFTFWDAGSNGHRQGYYDDPTSLKVKYDMVIGNGAAGIGIWHLGMDTGVPELWNLIDDRFAKRQIRIGGADRYATAAQLSALTNAPGVPLAYVATGTTFADALAAGPAAARAGGPILLTNPNSLSAATAGELARLRPQRIIVVGSAGAVSDVVLQALRPYATTGVVTRIGGADRYATSAAISAATFGPGAPVAYLATGLNFADALPGGVAAARSGGPILLTMPMALPGVAAAELQRLRPGRIVVLGGPSVVSEGVLALLRGYATSGIVTRLAGADRYGTALAVSQSTDSADSPATVYIATGTSFADGLAGTPAAARAGGPLLTVPSSTLPQAVADELRRLNPPNIVVLGSTGAVSNALYAQISALWH